MQNATQRKATLDTLLAVLETKRAQREEAQRQTRKDNEDKKLSRLRPWWLDAAQ